ncbi:MAG: hypothetical protein OXC57_10760, partial [Rhodobacteraceae bacterium]|nr:hypothetical protein [Paracoccaceae bacterium]
MGIVLRDAVQLCQLRPATGSPWTFQAMRPSFLPVLCQVLAGNCRWKGSDQQADDRSTNTQDHDNDSERHGINLDGHVP